MSERKLDLSWDALVEVTGATVEVERGALNAALKAIRSASSELEDADLAILIRLRADAYRKAFPDAALTPSALAKHWGRVQAEARTVKPSVALPPPADWALCGLCQNDGWVFVAGTESSAPCPECDLGRKAERMTYKREGGFWDGKQWLRDTSAPQTVVLT